MSAPRLAGRRILVTGAASGIGAAIARLFTEEGARIAALDRNVAATEALAEETGGVAVPADLQDVPATAAAVARAAEGLGGLDGVVNCAGINLAATIEETDLAAWQRLMAVNLTGPYVVCRAALPALRQARGSTIVNFSSGVGLMPLPRMGAYAASKGGLLAFTKSLAMEVAPDIRVNAICPGAVETPMVVDRFHGAALDKLVSNYALRRLGTARELADAALFLTGPEGSFITGTTLAVDGGRSFH